MKIKWNDVLINLDGEGFKDETFKLLENGLFEKVDGEDVTLGNIAVKALTNTHPSESNITGEKKFDQGMIAYKIRQSPDKEFNTTEIAEIKRLIGLFYGPAIVLATWQLLENKKQKA